jgi:hypothetical protein
MILPAIGITLIVSYFIIHSRNKDHIKEDASASGMKNGDTFNNALAMVLSLGSMLTAFGLGSFLSSCSGNTDSTASVLFYNGAIMVVMLLVVVFAFIARSKIDTETKGQDSSGERAGSESFIDIIIVLALIGFLGTGFLVYQETKGKSMNNFGFDFEF